MSCIIGNWIIQSLTFKIINEIRDQFFQQILNTFFVTNSFLPISQSSLLVQALVISSHLSSSDSLLLLQCLPVESLLNRHSCLYSSLWPYLFSYALVMSQHLIHCKNLLTSSFRTLQEGRPDFLFLLHHSNTWLNLPSPKFSQSSSH